jgi:glyceraldehyde 3-phosphate dehydrogenase
VTKSLFIFHKNILHLDWKIHNIDFVIESTGKYKTYEDLSAHPGAKVILSAPSEVESIKTVVLKSMSTYLTVQKRLSNASCTTNNAAPMMKIIDELSVA